MSKLHDDVRISRRDNLEIDNTIYIKFMTMLMDYATNDFLVPRENINKSFDYYREWIEPEFEAKEGTEFDRWCDYALKEILDTSKLQESFNELQAGNLDLDEFISKKRCTEYLIADFRKYDRFFSVSLRKAIEEIRKEEERYIFRREKDKWMIVYDGQRVVLDRPYVGLGYYQTLLRNPHERIAPLDLKSRCGVMQADTIIEGQKYEDYARNYGVRKRALTYDLPEDLGSERDNNLKTQYKIEGLSRNQIKNALDRINAQFEACSSGDEFLDLEEKKRYLQKQLKSSFPSKSNTARLNLIKTTNYARNAINKKCPLLATFLRTYVYIGNPSIYTPPPDNPITWKF